MSAPLDISTPRLQLRWLDSDDAPFILRLVTDADWLRFIGDKGVADLDGARRYLETGPLRMYREQGFGLNRVALNTGGETIGICGLLKREELANVDLGFAFLPEFRGRGYAREAAAAVLDHGRETLGIDRVVAIVAAGNTVSIGLLEKLGFAYEKEFSREPGAPPVGLYGIELADRRK